MHGTVDQRQFQAYSSHRSWQLSLLVGLARHLLVGHNTALIFYILASVAGGYDIATHAIPGLLKGKFDTDVLMLAAAFGAAVLGEWAEGAFLLLLFSLGHAGEHYAPDRARDAVNALGRLMPRTALVKKDEQIVELPVGMVQVDDIVIVRPGDHVPGDDLRKLPFAVGLSRASRAVIRQNLGVALGVIAVLLLTSVFGWV